MQTIGTVPLTARISQHPNILLHYAMRKYDFMEMLINIQRLRITDLTVVPPIVARLAKHPEVRAGQYDLSSVERVRWGGAPLGREICEEFERLWEGGKVK